MYKISTFIWWTTRLLSVLILISMPWHLWFVNKYVCHQTAALYTTPQFNLGVRLHFNILMAQLTVVPRLLGNKVWLSYHYYCRSYLIVLFVSANIMQTTSINDSSFCYLKVMSWLEVWLRGKYRNINTTILNDFVPNNVSLST